MLQRKSNRVSEAAVWAAIHAAGAFVLVAFILVPLIELTK